MSSVAGRQKLSGAAAAATKASGPSDAAARPAPRKAAPQRPKHGADAARAEMLKQLHCDPVVH